MVKRTSARRIMALRLIEPIKRVFKEEGFRWFYRVC